MKKHILLYIAVLAIACKNNQKDIDSSGTFESEEVMISTEAAGALKSFTVEEGQKLESGQLVGFVDSTQLYLKKLQLESQIRSTLSQRPDVSAQLAALQVQLAAAEKEQQRISNLLKADAATPKQLDDITAQVNVLKKQIAAQQSSLGITTESITQQTSPLQVQIAQVNDQLAKCRIVNPINGTVLTKYAEAGEIVGMGKALYKIADLSELTLRAYFTGDQFSKVKLGQKVSVLVDEGDKSRTYEGTISWISDKAEFTPKTIQTKDERANLVYAVKIRVKNDGLLKIGMYADVKL